MAESENSAFNAQHSAFPSMTQEEFLLWQDVIQKKIGIIIEDNKTDFLGRRLWGRMKQLSIHSYGSYYHFVLNENRNQGEWQELIEVLVNAQSSFFRHGPSYDALINIVFPELVEKRNRIFKIDGMFPDNGNLEKYKNAVKVSIWSVGCSRGQEAYSLAMAFSHAFKDKNDDYCVIGTDISLNALERARKAEYSYMEIRDMPEFFRDKYMIEIREEKRVRNDAPSESPISKHKFRYRVKDNIRNHVKFIHMNILGLNSISFFQDLSLTTQDSGLISQDYDVIFCQNVFIYFTVHVRAKIISSLIQYLRPEGYIFLSPGETVGIKIVSGATLERFKDSLVYKRNKEAVNVQVIH